MSLLNNFLGTSSGYVLSEIFGNLEGVIPLQISGMGNSIGGIGFENLIRVDIFDYVSLSTQRCEYGFNVSDHATVDGTFMQLEISDTTVSSLNLKNFLLKLKDSRKPVSVVLARSGYYSNMVVTSIEETIDENYINGIRLRVSLQEQIFSKVAESSYIPDTSNEVLKDYENSNLDNIVPTKNNSVIKNVTSSNIDTSSLGNEVKEVVQEQENISIIEANVDFGKDLYNRLWGGKK